MNKKEANNRAVKKYQQTEKGKATRERAAKKYGITEKARLKYVRKNLKNNYGLTLKQYDEIFEEQGGVCELCGGTNVNGYRLCVDHDHKTGKIRGLLCHKCNVKLGVIENVDFAARVKKYLKKHKQ